MGMYGREATWLSSEAAEIVEYLEDLNQDIVRAFRRAATLLSGLLPRCDRESIDLFETARLFAQLRTAYERHWAGERGGFLAAIERSSPSPAFLAVWGETLAEEHQELLELLQGIRAATFNYSLPPDTRTHSTSPGGAGLGYSRAAVPEFQCAVEQVFFTLRDVDGDIRGHIAVVRDRLLPMLSAGGAGGGR